MPELPEVEVLVNHLRPLLKGRTIRRARINRARIVRPLTSENFEKRITGWTIRHLTRRAKYLVFELQRVGRSATLLGHLGMSGRMWVLPKNSPLPKHSAAVFELGREQFVFEDTRYFGRLLLGDTVLAALGPEPLGNEFTPERFSAALSRSAQPIKIKLLDQRVVAGLGNIYVNEALHQARLCPSCPAKSLTKPEIARLRGAIRKILRRAISSGSTLPVFGGEKKTKSRHAARKKALPSSSEARFRVYDRFGQPCDNCQTPIKRIVQGARSTFFCPKCQKPR